MNFSLFLLYLAHRYEKRKCINENSIYIACETNMFISYTLQKKHQPTKNQNEKEKKTNSEQMKFG